MYTYRIPPFLQTTLLALIACALGTLVACACPLLEDTDKAEEVDQQNELLSNAYGACPALAKVQEESGAILGGSYGDASLAEYIISGSPNAPQVRPPNGSACAQEIASRLVQACNLCQRQPASCTSVVESFMNAPSGACVTCGDGLCTSPEESSTTCPEDCRCGNGQCEPNLTTNAETPFTCPQDCAGTCGDDYCATPFEACECEEGDENCTPCVDCCLAVCGDGVCRPDQGENDPENERAFCEVDCGKGACGDGICNPSENQATCPRDCTGLQIGDGTCEAPETCFNAPEDCSTPSTCLDGVCGNCEPITCPVDCEGFDYTCGDGTCEGIETRSNCPQDCTQDPPRTCDDGFCSTTDLGNCQECNPNAACNSAYRCVADERLCLTRTQEDYILDCTDSTGSCRRPQEIPCEGRCNIDATGRAECVSCPSILDANGIPAEQIQLCPQHFEPFCVGPASLRICTTDPSYSSDTACQVLRTQPCEGRCDNGVCTNNPAITNLAPNPAAPGSILTITGAALGDEPGTVLFTTSNATTPGDLIFWDEVSIGVRIPETAETGTVTVQRADGSEATSENPLQIRREPHIRRVVPNSAYLGYEVRIEGYGFGTEPGSVLFTPSRSAQINSWSNTLIRAVVPLNAGDGPITLRFGATTLTSEPIDVSTAPGSDLSISNIEPRNIRPGTLVTITGRNFGPYGSVVFYPNAPGDVVSWNTDTITVRVPTAIRSGAARVIAGSNTRSTAELTVLPTILSMSTCGDEPAGRIGDTLVIEGVGFENQRGDGFVEFSPNTDTTQVRIGGWSFNRITVTVPETTETGPVTVHTTNRGSITSDQDFSLLPDPPTTYGYPLWPIPDSPNVRCTDTTAFIPCPSQGEPFYGQDGSIDTTPSQPILQNNDTATFDPATNLLWQRYAHPLPQGQRNFTSARCFCDNLTLSGHSDWRLPTIIELLSAFDHANQRFDPNLYPALLNHPYTNPIPTSQRLSGSDQIFYINHNDGVVSTTPASNNNITLARCVRTDTPPTRQPLIITDTSVTDPNTRLLWQRTPSQGTWTQALTTCNDLSTEGLNDWRLPSIRELATIQDFSLETASRFIPDLWTFDFLNPAPNTVWTSTPSPTDPTRVFTFPITYGSNARLASETQQFICVHTAP